MVTNLSLSRFGRSTNERYTNMANFGQRPALKQKVKSMLHRKEALRLIGEGLPVTVVAERLKMTVQSVRRHLRGALASESLFPSGLDADQVATLRQIEGERLTRLWQRAQSALETIEARIGSDCEKSLDGSAVARLIDSGTRVSEQISKLYGLAAPTKIVEESMRLSVTKIDQKVTVSFDRNQLSPNIA